MPLRCLHPDDRVSLHSLGAPPVPDGPAPRAAGVLPDLDLKELQELIQFISKSEFHRFEMENEGLRLKLVRGGPLPTSVPPPAVPPVAPGATVSPEGNGRPAAVVTAPPAAAPAADLHEVRSPIVGTFYRASGPTSPVFVEAGSRVAAGQTLCIIEAMKLMNEIESDVDGEIVEVVVANAQPVEYGQVLFRIRPAAA